MPRDAEAVYEVLSPEGRSRVVGVSDTAGVDDLDTAVIAQVWDYMFRGDAVFSYIREAVTARYPGIRFVEHTAFGNVHGPEQEALTAALPARMREHGCTAAMVGIGA